MDQKDIELEKALDDLFGDASSSDNEKTNINYEIIDKTDDNISSDNDYSFEKIEVVNNDKDTEYIENDTMIFPSIEPDIFENDKESHTITFSNEETENINEFAHSTIDTNQDEIGIDKQQSINDSFGEEPVENNNVVQDDVLIENNLDVKKIIIYFIIGILLGFILIFFLLKRDKEKEVGVINCSFASEDDNYKITEQYKITHVDDIISYVEGTYLYTAKTEEFEKQVEFVKKDKLPAIINSNGMSGFTYIPETSSNYFKVQTYLDYDAFDINAIKNINQDTTPLSFFTINVDKKYEDLKNNLEKKGFKCILSK